MPRRRYNVDNYDVVFFDVPDTTNSLYGELSGLCCESQLAVGCIDVLHAL